MIIDTAVTGKEGYFDITITFNPATKEIGISAEYKSIPTGISSVKAAGLNGAEVYNLNGQCVLNAQKSLYIVNGKKVVLK